MFYGPNRFDCFGAPQSSWTRFLKAPSPPTCPLSNRRSLSS